MAARLPASSQASPTDRQAVCAGYDLIDQAAYAQMAQLDYMPQYAGSEAACAGHDQMGQAAYAQMAQQEYMPQYTGSQAFQGMEQQADRQAWGLYGDQWAMHREYQQAGTGPPAPSGQAATPGHQQPHSLGQWPTTKHGRAPQGHGLAGGGASSTTWAGQAAAEPGAAGGAAVKRPRRMLSITAPKSAATALAPANEPAGKAGRQAAAASTGAGEVAAPEAGPSAGAQQNAAAELAAGRRAADEAEAGVSAQDLQNSALAADPGTAEQAAAMAEAKAKPAAAREAEARLGFVTGSADGAPTQPAGGVLGLNCMPSASFQEGIHLAGLLEGVAVAAGSLHVGRGRTAG